MEMQETRVAQLNAENIFSYLDQIKSTFYNQPQVYNNFLSIMDEFKSQRIDVKGVAECICKLFQGHPQLILGFNAFVSPICKIGILPNGQIAIWYNFSTVLEPNGKKTFSTNLTLLSYGPSPATTAIHPVDNSLSNHSTHTDLSQSLGSAVLDQINFNPFDTTVMPVSNVQVPSKDSKCYNRQSDENSSSGGAEAASNEFHCPVCLISRQELPAGSYFSAPMCGHIICNICISSIQASEKKCPVCRKEFGICRRLYIHAFSFPNSSSGKAEATADEFYCPFCLITRRELTADRYFLAPLCGHIMCNICISSIETSEKKCPVCSNDCGICRRLYF